MYNTANWLYSADMTKTQGELQVAHENEIKKVQGEKKAVQRDLTSSKSKVKSLEEARHKLEEEVYTHVYYHVRSFMLVNMLA